MYVISRNHDTNSAQNRFPLFVCQNAHDSEVVNFDFEIMIAKGDIIEKATNLRKY